MANTQVLNSKQTLEKQKESTSDTGAYLLRVSVLIVALVTAMVALKQANERSESKKELDLYRKESILLIEHEKSLYKMHEASFDQGYQTAVWDLFLGKPRYIVAEGEDQKLSLWKNQAISRSLLNKVEQEREKLREMGEKLNAPE